MAAVIRSFDYSRVRGRGKGVLGLKEFRGVKNSSETVDVQEEKKAIGPSSGGSKPVGVALYNYKANPDSPGGFEEMDLHQGQLVEILREHPDNEHWWEVRTDGEEVGYVPSSYVIIKDQKALPWLQEAALKSEEEERKLRVTRLKQEQSAIDGTGCGPPPKDVSTLAPKPYQSTYGNSTSACKFYCEVCDKKLNGIKPYQAHMHSKAHKEEMALLEEQEQ